MIRIAIIRKNGARINKILNENILSKIFFHVGMATGFEFREIFINSKCFL